MRILLGTIIALLACAPASGATGTGGANHPRGRAFMPLPAGAVRPRGWLGDRAQAAARGNVGNIDCRSEKFKVAWSPDFLMTGDDLYWLKRRGWPYEGGGYWFDGLTRLALELDDPRLIAKAQGKLDGVVTNMTAQGLGFLWWLKGDDPNLDQIPPMGNKWVVAPYGMFGRAVAAMQQARPTARYREALVNAFSLNPKILECGWTAVTPQAAVMARELTGDRAIDAALDEYYAKVRAGRFPRLMKPVPSSWKGIDREQTPLHGVTFFENLAGTLFGYIQTGDRMFLDNARCWILKMEEIGLLPNGAFAADEYFRPAGAYVGTEVCSIAAHQWLLVNLLSADGDGAWGDRVESLFFNAGESVFTRKCTANPVTVYPNRPRTKGKYFVHAGSGCCSANAARILPVFVQHLWMSTADGGLAAVLYAPSEVSATVADGVGVKIETSTAYPYDETIHMRVSPDREASFPLRLRLPQWCGNPSLAVNGRPERCVAERGFVRLSRSWRAGDRVTLRLPMVPRTVRAVDKTNPARHFGNSNPGEYTTTEWLADQDDSLAAESVSVRLGPLCMSLGIPELDDTGNAPDKSTPWQFVIDPESIDAKVERLPMPAVWDAPFASPVRVSVAARSGKWTHNENAPRLPTPKEVSCGAPCRLTLVPFCCTAFRVTQFPALRD